MKKLEFVESLAQEYKRAGLITNMYYKTNKDIRGEIVGELIHMFFSDGREACFSVYDNNEKEICKEIARAIVRIYG